MKHGGKAMKSAVTLLTWAVVLLGVLAVGLRLVGVPVGWTLGAVLGPFVGFAAFTLYFFRDPTAQVPNGTGLVVAPAHGKVDIIDEIEEREVMGGRCRRVSIFLSVFNVHVQQAPVAGRVMLVKHNPGKFLNALKAESATENENVLIGFDATEPGQGRVGMRLLAGLIARRIIPWLKVGEDIQKGERVSLIQFGSRVDIYLPLSAKVEVRMGQKVVGGETIVARWQA
jgi:phosphatidylserine decarboxylase